MNWKALLAICTSAAMWVACQKSVCGEFLDAQNNYATKFSACIPDAGPIGNSEGVDAGVSTCEQHVSDCTDADKAAIDSYVKCINALSNCTPATQQQWTTEFLACYTNNIQGLSTACITTLGH